ncbi:MAG: MmgE/PrpD family protein [Burkholderiales bacterium]|nr:MmgE/PrpD family protein [Burkholderiales bacterium]
MSEPNAAVGAAEPAPAATPSISQQIAAFAADLSLDDVAQRVRENAKLHVLDVCGTALAATRFDFAQHALAGIANLGESGGNSVIGMNISLPMRDAVLMNGILAHGLDYDDTHPSAIVHPTASAFPCALGLAEHRDAAGADLLLAYILGVEIATRLGVAARGAMLPQGFHTTGIAGHFGCAVAAGKLFNLGAQRLQYAQGFAGSTASAIAEHRADGAWNKRLHPAWAGVGGITAAALASGGFVGTRKVYEGVDGIFRSHTGTRFNEVDMAAMTRRLGEEWLLEEVAIKPFPICHFLHACADSALAIQRRHQVRIGDIVKVRALLHPGTFHSVAEPAEMRRRPVSDYMAKFSVQFVVAACLVRGRFGFAELETEALNDPQILALAQKVHHEADPDSAFPKYFSGGVVVTLKDGREFVHMEKINRGAGERALTADEIADKFFDNATLVISRPQAERIRDAVLDMDRRRARDLARTLALKN